MELKIVGISDVHDKWREVKIPQCDILISAGDYSFHGSPMAVNHYHQWLNNQPAKHIISVQGNHETWVEKNFEDAKAIALRACPRVHFMEEGLVVIDGVNIWCSAITPWFHDWAYNRVRGEEIQKHWNQIPDNTNILVTHGPPAGILDIVPRADGTPKERVGCHDLLARIKELKDLDLHFFGHIHESHGQHHEDGVSFYNVAVCDGYYMPSNGVTVVDYVRD